MDNLYRILLLLLILLILYFIVVFYEKDNSPVTVDKITKTKWVAVGDGDGYNSILYSETEKVWQQSDTGASFGGPGNGVAYGTSDGTNPLWVAVGIGAETSYNSILYSEDGKVWQQSHTGISFKSNIGKGVAYGTSDGTSTKQLWVAVGQGDVAYRNILHSENGKVWQQSHTGISFNTIGNGVAYGTSDGTSPLWVAVGEGDTGYNSILYSENGKVWNQPNTGISFKGTGGNGVAYGTSDGTSPLWVAVGDGNPDGYNSILYSENGKVWQQPNTGISFKGAYRNGGVAYGTSDGTSPLWVAVGDGDGDGYNSILYSENGKVWQQSDTGASFKNNVGYDVAYRKVGNDILWVAVGNGDTGYNSILYSENGKVWQQSDIGASFTDNYGYGVAANHLLYGMSKDYYHF